MSLSDPRTLRALSHPPVGQAGQVEFLLRAERNAEDSVAEEERAAQRTLETSREQALRIATRADARIAALTVRASESVKRRIDVMRRESEVRGAARRRPLAETSHVDAAVQRVVVWLLGEDTGGKRGAGR